MQTEALSIGDGRDRYAKFAQAMHWIAAALMFAVVPSAWAAVALPEHGKYTETVFTLHKSIGLTILALTAARLAWRASHPAPKLPGHMAKWEEFGAKLSHWLLYAILLGMPISGYIVSVASAHEVTYFGLFTIPPLLPTDKTLESVGLFLHVLTGQWFVYALILLHLGATAWHIVIHRDGILDRMLPPQDGLGLEERR